MPKVRNSIAVALTIFAIGCQTWRPVTLEVTPDPSRRPSEIEITTRAGARLTVYDPEVRGDSLHGWFDTTKRNSAGFALSDITSARSRHLSGGRTAGLMVGLVIGALALLILGFLLTFDGSR